MSNKLTRVFDVIVVGGGPAGSAFAIAAAQAGMRVKLLEKTSFAHHKVCGEFLSVETQILLQRLGINLDDMGAPTQSELRLVNRGQIATSNLPFSGRSLSRRLLDEALLEQAVRSGVFVERQAQATRFSHEESEGRSTITLSGGEKLSALHVVLAMGESTVRGVSGREHGALVAYKMVLSLNRTATLELKNRVQLMAYDGGYQGALLVENEMASLAWIMRPDQAKQLGNVWTRHQEFLSAQSDLVGDLLTDSKTDWEKALAVSGLKFGFLRKDPIAKNVYPVGRQMAIIPSFTGDGLAIALATGIFAAQAVANGVSAQSYLDHMRKILRHQFLWANAVHPMFLNSWSRRVGLAAAKRFPAIVQKVTNSTRLRHLPD